MTVTDVTEKVTEVTEKKIVEEPEKHRNKIQAVYDGYMIGCMMPYGHILPFLVTKI